MFFPKQIRVSAANIRNLNYFWIVFSLFYPINGLRSMLDESVCPFEAWPR